MPRHSVNLTQPVFRHFVPEAEDLFFAPKDPGAFFISLKRMLIQGANPRDPKLIKTLDVVPALQFQGGYRCIAEIVTNPPNGTVVISWDKMGFEYTPNPGFKGLDAFGYRIVNVMGQPSNVCCISINVKA